MDSSMRLPASVRLLIRIVIVGSVFLCSGLILFVLNARSQREYRDSLDDSGKYVMNFVTLLGSNWESNTTIHDDKDIREWSDTTIAGRSQIWTYNSDRSSSIKDHVIAYVD